MFSSISHMAEYEASRSFLYSTKKAYAESASPTEPASIETNNQCHNTGYAMLFLKTLVLQKKIVHDLMRRSLAKKIADVETMIDPVVKCL